MYKRLFLIASGVFILSSCGDDSSSSKSVDDPMKTESETVESVPTALDDPIEEKSGYKVTSSGLKFKILREGEGEMPAAGDRVKVHYEGKLTSGKVFDASYDRGEPIEFILGRGQVIPGWDEGISLLNVGSKAEFYIPSVLAYGEKGRPPVIPPNSDLIFTVELIDFVTPQQPKPYNVEGKEEKSTGSGLKYIIVESKGGPKPTKGQTVVVNYTGYLEDGSMFDSSIPRGAPFEFPLGAGRVIKGWDEGIALLGVGDKARLIIPAELGYGPRATGSIPANSTLIFDVELVGIK